MPRKSSKELINLRERNVPRGPYNITPLFAESATGAVLRDVEGREYIDFAGGIGVQNLGHGQAGVVRAIREQAELLVHTCFHVVMYESYIALAERLNNLAPGSFHKKTFFVNSGAEAVENAVKIARTFTKRPAIVSFENAFHGRTYMAMSLTSQIRPYKLGFGPFCSEVFRLPFAYCYRCPFGLAYPGCEIRCADSLKRLFLTQVGSESIAAVIAEPVQGEGGFIVPPPEFLPRIKSVCENEGIVFIADEIQTGMGRTGRLFASEHFSLEPDILLTGKSLGGGVPLAGITGKAEIMDSPHAGGLGGTFSGNPIACRAGLAVLDLLDETTLAKSVSLGKSVKECFLDFQKRFEIIGDVRGIGPMVAMELVKSRNTKEPAADETSRLVRRCSEKGLIILSCGVQHNVVRTLIPFAITAEQLQKGFDILGEVLMELGK
ncbi:MAG: 4-aminobutyrate--2-oxoglutarate transaminase [Desulfobacteraceae bacterium]|nr:MAG: 4-aminobutyrate--2-oxoglutarate transaminase [Desulfobacteraceae bacterium]